MTSAGTSRSSSSAATATSSRASRRSCSRRPPRSSTRSRRRSPAEQPHNGPERRRLGRLAPRVRRAGQCVAASARHRATAPACRVRCVRARADPGREHLRRSRSRPDRCDRRASPRLRCARPARGTRPAQLRRRPVRRPARSRGGHRRRVGNHRVSRCGSRRGRDRVRRVRQHLRRAHPTARSRRCRRCAPPTRP